MTRPSLKAFFVGASFAAGLGIASAIAATLHTFNASEQMSSFKMNENFQRLNAELSTLRADLEEVREGESSGRTPAGTILAFAGPISALPPGWLLCDGQSVSRMDHQKLFEAIGTTYGGAGSPHFQLPDLRGRVVLGAGQGVGLTPRVLGNTFGSESSSLTVEQLPARSHTGATGGGNAMSYRLVHAAGIGSEFNHATGYSIASYNDVNDSNWPLSGHTHNFTTDATGSGQAFSVLPPALTLNFIIKI